MWMQEAVVDVAVSLNQYHNDIILTPQVSQNPNIWPKECGYNCLRLLPYTHGRHINKLKQFLYV